MKVNRKALTKLMHDDPGLHKVALECLRVHAGLVDCTQEKTVMAINFLHDLKVLETIKPT